MTATANPLNVLSHREEARAVAYNGTRYSADFWTKVQRVVGTVPDGRPGPLTAQAVARWQRAAGLDADGMVGPITAAAIASADVPRPDTPPPTQPSSPLYPPPISPVDIPTLAARANAAALRVGVWWDLALGWSIQRADELLSRVRACGVSLVIVMADSATATGRADFKWPVAQHVEWAHALRRHGIESGVAIWPEPKPGWLTSAKPRLMDMIRDSEPTVIDLDVEGNWEPRDVSGYASLAAAARDLHDTIRAIAPAATLTTTTFPYHGEYTPQGSTIVALCDATTPQAYSRNRDGTRGWGTQEGPRRMQQLAMRRTSHLPPTVTRHMGLAAWDQPYAATPQHPALPAWVAMSAALDETITLLPAHPTAIYWSAKHIWGPNRNSYAEKWLTDLETARRGGASPC